MASPVKPPPQLIKPEKGFFKLLQRMALSLGKWIQNPLFPQAVVCLLITALYTSFVQPAWFEKIENLAHDTFFKHRAMPVHEDIVFIEIAEDSIQSIGRWPWARRYHGVMTHILTAWGAKAVVYDVLFSEPSSEYDDTALEQALEKSPRAYLPVILEPSGNEKKWIHSLPVFEKNAKGIGHINIEPDKDGTLRRIRPFIDSNGKVYPHLALKTAFDVLGRPEGLENLSFPLDREGKFIINWAGKWETTFTHYSYVDIIKSFQASQSGGKPLISPEQIKGKICIIGLTATGHADIKVTPLESAAPGIELHANIINGVLQNSYVSLPSIHLQSAATLLLALFAVVLLIFFRNLFSFVSVVALSSVWVGFCYIIFIKKGLLFPIFQPVILVLILLLFSGLYTLVILKKEKFKFFELATRDGLTGLFVIRYFRTLLAAGMSEAEKKAEPLSVILIDIDNFKKINDTYGHQMGDAVLRNISQALQMCIRLRRDPGKDDVPCRYGGEELIIMVRNADLANAAFVVAERIRKSIETSVFRWEKTTLQATISLGVATLHPGDTVDKLIRRADEALYRAKKEGKNRVCVENFKEQEIEREKNSDH